MYQNLKKRAAAQRIVCTYLLIFIMALCFAVSGCASDQSYTETPDESEVETISTGSSVDMSSAIEMDERIFDIVLASEESTNALLEGMGIVGEGGGSMFELYDLAKQVKENHFNAFSALSKLSDKSNSDYIDAAQLFVINGQQIAEDIMKYIDKDEMKYLSRAKENIEVIQDYTISVVTARMSYLASQGLTTEEITAVFESGAAE